MSRGPSRAQLRVLEILRKKGSVDIFDLLQTRLYEHHRQAGMTESQLLAAAEKPMGPNSAEWKEITQKLEVRNLAIKLLQSDRYKAYWDRRSGARPLESRGEYATTLYRMMASLVRRGLAAAIVNAQPRAWVAVTWHDGYAYVDVDRILEHLNPHHMVCLAGKGWVLNFQDGIYRIPRPELPRRKRLVYRLVGERPRRRAYGAFQLRGRPRTRPRPRSCR